MINIGIAVTGGIFYLTGRYNMALLLLVLAIISGAGAAIMSVVNPDWYFQKRIQAGLEVDFLNPGKGIGLKFTDGIEVVRPQAQALPPDPFRHQNSAIAQGHVGTGSAR
jgi:hypothetical protein